MKDTEARQNEKKPSDFEGFMPLINTAFGPGKCIHNIGRMENGPKKRIAIAEYYYFSGQPENAVEEVRNYLNHTEMALRLSAKLIFSYASLSMGEIYAARDEIQEIKKLYVYQEQDSNQIKVMKGFVAAASAVLLHLPLPQNLPRLSEVSCYIPLGLRAFSIYIYCHYLYLKKDYGRSAGMAEAALIMGGEKYPIPAIYLHLVAVMDYMSLKETGKAKEHFLTAWELARADDLIEAFGEHHGLLGGMLESVIKPEWPEDFKRMIHITYHFSSGWRKIHNPATGEKVANELTTTEFAVAMLAARGWTNQEIAFHMNISPNTVKWHLSRAMDRLRVSRRLDLKDYMLQ